MWDELPALPRAATQIQPAELGEIDGPPVKPALHFLEAVVAAIQAPRAGRIDPKRLPELFGQLGRHGPASSAFQDHAEQEGMEIVMLPVTVRRDIGPHAKRECAQVWVVVGARIIGERAPTGAGAVVTRPGGHRQEVSDPDLVKAGTARQLGQLASDGVLDVGVTGQD